jgi:hypothetical protein
LSVEAEDGIDAEHGEELLLGVKLDYLELDEADALLPAGRLILPHLVDGVGLHPVEASAGLRLRDRRHLRDHGVLLVGAVDVVARREGGRPRGDKVVVVATVRDGEPRCAT